MTSPFQDGCFAGLRVWAEESWRGQSFWMFLVSDASSVVLAGFNMF